MRAPTFLVCRGAAPRALWSLLLVATLVPAAATAQAPVDERVVDSIVTAGMKEHRLVGLSVTLMRGGHVALQKAYGEASLQPRVPVDTLTRFSIGSVTKEFVASLTLLLQEDGKLSCTTRCPSGIRS